MAPRKPASPATEHALGAALLGLYRVSRSVTAPEFKDASLEAIKQHLPFDAAMWGTFVVSQEGAIVHSVHLHRLPPEKMRDYEQVKRSDVLYRRGIETPGRTSIGSLARMEKKLDPALVAYARRYDLANVLSTVWIDPVLQIYTAVSFYRGSRGPAFAERERRMKEELMPHLVEAWNLNAIQYLDRPGGTPSARARALVDGHGMLYNAEPQFAELMRQEFPEWVGPILPQAMALPVLGAGAESFRGDALVASRLREVENGMYLVGARALTGIDKLSPRELTVARAFAAGRTYKEIAHTLGVAPATIRNQLQAAYGKLGVASKIELARQLGSGD